MKLITASAAPSFVLTPSRTVRLSVHKGTLLNVSDYVTNTSLTPHEINVYWLPVIWNSHKNKHQPPMITELSTDCQTTIGRRQAEKGSLHIGADRAMGSESTASLLTKTNWLLVFAIRQQKQDNRLREDATRRPGRLGRVLVVCDRLGGVGDDRVPTQRRSER